MCSRNAPLLGKIRYMLSSHLPYIFVRHSDNHLVYSKCLQYSIFVLLLMYRCQMLSPSLYLLMQLSHSMMLYRVPLFWVGVDYSTYTCARARARARARAYA